MKKFLGKNFKRFDIILYQFELKISTKNISLLLKLATLSFFEIKLSIAITFIELFNTIDETNSKLKIL
jgi:hypothetical protein